MKRFQFVYGLIFLIVSAMNAQVVNVAGMNPQIGITDTNNNKSMMPPTTNVLEISFPAGASMSNQQDQTSTSGVLGVQLEMKDLFFLSVLANRGSGTTTISDKSSITSFILDPTNNGTSYSLAFSIMPWPNEGGYLFQKYIGAFLPWRYGITVSGGLNSDAIWIGSTTDYLNKSYGLQLGYATIGVQIQIGSIKIPTGKDENGQEVNNWANTGIELGVGGHFLFGDAAQPSQDDFRNSELGIKDTAFVEGYLAGYVTLNQIEFYSKLHYIPTSLEISNFSDFQVSFGVKMQTKAFSYSVPFSTKKKQNR